jgi:hypothetical protein
MQEMNPEQDKEDSQPKLWDAIAATIFFTILIFAVIYWLIVGAIMMNE